MDYCLFLLSVVLLTVSCNQHNVDVIPIRERYSRKVINYFYEVGLHADAHGNKRTQVQKWDQDVSLSIMGDTLVGDSIRIRRVIEQINALHLPIKIQVTTNQKSANMIIYFGSRSDLGVADGVGGRGDITSSEGVIKYAEIRIPNLSDNLKGKKLRNRESIILEEIIQCLGLPGDSFAHPLSIFYQHDKDVNQLMELDKQMLHLLYDSAMPVEYTCEQFEKDFADELYHINSEEKLLQYLQKQNVQRQTIERIIEHGLIKRSNQKNEQPQIIKFNQPIAVTVQGDTTARHISMLRQTIQKLNQVSDQLQLYLATDSLPHDGGIHYHFQQVDQLESPTSSIATKVVTHSTQRLLFHRRFKTDVYVSYKDTTALQQKMPMAISNTLYQTISLVHQPKPLFFAYQEDSLYLEPEYAEVLRTYYAPELANNMTKEQLESVLAQMPSHLSTKSK